LGFGCYSVQLQENGGGGEIYDECILCLSPYTSHSFRSLPSIPVPISFAFVPTTPTSLTLDCPGSRLPVLEFEALTSEIDCSLHRRASLSVSVPPPVAESILVVSSSADSDSTMPVVSADRAVYSKSYADIADSDPFKLQGLGRFGDGTAQCVDCRLLIGMKASAVMPDSEGSVRISALLVAIRPCGNVASDTLECWRRWTSERPLSFSSTSIERAIRLDELARIATQSGGWRDE
jgi:hypothetical protein